MNTVICLEGPDNIGKTRFAKILSVKYDTPILHLGPPKSKDKKEVQAEQTDLAFQVVDDTVIWGSKQDNAFRVWDRSILGEAVYGKLYRDYDTRDYVSVLKKLLHSIPNVQIFLIIFWADGYTYPKFNIPPKKDEKILYQQVGEAGKISKRFVEVANELSLPHTLIVSCNDYLSLEHRNSNIIRWIKLKLGEL